MPNAWKLDAERILAERRCRLDLDDQFARFCNYWWGKSGRDATKLDWAATWNNWVRTSCDRAAGRSFGAGPAPERVGTLKAGEVD